MDKEYSRDFEASLLHRLSSSEAGAAWTELLDRYAPLIMNTAAQFEYEQDRIDDCFIHVCGKLHEDGFKRLLKFHTDGAATFRTWLSAVVFNLCVDWHRKEFGRVVVLPAISALPAFDQSVYRHIVEQGLTKESCYQTLKADFPDLTRQLVAKSLGRIHSLLTPRQRWQISLRLNRRRSREGDLQDWLETLPAEVEEPETEIQAQQESEILQEALSRLPTGQRLLIELRFRQGLSLERITRIQHLGDTNRAWRHIEAAKTALFDQVRRLTSEQKRKS